MTTLVSVLAALVVVALLVVRRARPRPVAEESFRKPLVLTVVGLFLLHDVVLDAPAAAAFLVLTGCLALGLGAARGALVRVGRAGGQLVTSWGPACFGLMALLVVLRLGLDAGAVSLGVASHTVGQSVLFALGLSLLAESAVVAARTAAPRRPLTGPGGSDVHALQADRRQGHRDDRDPGEDRGRPGHPREDTVPSGTSPGIASEATRRPYDPIDNPRSAGASPPGTSPTARRTRARPAARDGSAATAARTPSSTPPP